jgi:hypothetical protein
MCDGALNGRSIQVRLASINLFGAQVHHARLRVSPAVSRTRSRQTFFFIRTIKNGSVAFPVSHFHLDLGFHPSGELMSFRPPEECWRSPKETKAGEMSRKLSVRLVAPTCRREMPIVVLITSSSARGRVASTRRVNNVASNSRAVPFIYRGTAASDHIHHPRLPSLPSPNFSPQSPRASNGG